MLSSKPKLSTIGLANPIVLKISIVLCEVIIDVIDIFYYLILITIALNPGIPVICVIHLFIRF